jgi:NAD(P)-dependent dehydrogenase (short-subunit alcohol dehydrogenase family)
MRWTGGLGRQGGGTGWTAADIPDQTGRVAVVTGANSGLGLVTARELARTGAHVVLACRDTDKGEAASRDFVGGSHEVRRLDLADLDSVRAFAEELDKRTVDVLVNNAGIMNVPKGTTAQGHELQFGTNVLGHFLLTGLLLPRLTDRVVTLSSGVHRAGSIRLDDLGFERRRYNGWAAYGQSKLADLVLAYELQRRLVAAGSPLRSMAAHPGYAATNLQSHSGGWQDTLMAVMNRVPGVAQSADTGALPTLYAATVPDLPGGSYIGPGGFGELSGPPRVVGSSKASHDLDLATRLWAACEELTGQAFVVA